MIDKRYWVSDPAQWTQDGHARMLHVPSCRKSAHSEREKRQLKNRECSKLQQRMKIVLLSRAIKAREAMDNAVTVLPKLELIH